MNSTIYETLLREWCCIDVCLIGGGGPSAMGICAFYYM